MLEFGAKEILLFVLIFLSAIVASNLEFASEIGWRRVRIRLSQRNTVSKKKILMLVEFVILAKNHPEVVSVIHAIPPNSVGNRGPTDC
jgi:hypothetical protein